MRLKNAKSNVEIEKNVDSIATNFLSNDIIFFIVNLNLRVLLIVSKIARRFRMIDIAILIIRNDYTEKHAEKKKDRIFKKNQYANNQIR